MGNILPVANNCGNIHVRFSTFFILENVGKIKNVKKRKKRFLHLCYRELLGQNVSAKCGVLHFGGVRLTARMSRYLKAYAELLVQ